MYIFALEGLAGLVGDALRGEVCFLGDRPGVRAVDGVFAWIVGSGKPRRLAMMDSCAAVWGSSVGYRHSLFCGVSPVTT